MMERVQQARVGTLSYLMAQGRTEMRDKIKATLSTGEENSRRYDWKSYVQPKIASRFGNDDGPASESAKEAKRLAEERKRRSGLTALEVKRLEEKEKLDKQREANKQRLLTESVLGR